MNQSHATTIIFFILKKRFGIWYLVFGIFLLSLLLIPYKAEALGLKITPLKYEEQIELGSNKTGFVDVANPNDVTVTVTTSVKAFRQVDLDGNLEFYEDEQISKAIEVSLNKFDLEPREAARVLFSINSNRLPEGGVYGVVFFETTARSDGLDVSSIETTSRVGTLLIIQNGDNGQKNGRIDKLETDFWQFGSSIKGKVVYNNPDVKKSIGYSPGLTAKIPLNKKKDIDTGLVLPGASRQFTFNLEDNYIGLFPLTVTDDATGSTAQNWIFAVTGIWQIVLPAIIIALLSSLALYIHFKHLSIKRDD